MSADEHDITVSIRPPDRPRTPSVTDLPAGTVIAGRFALESLAGRGGMGAVYRARDQRRGQQVALKLLNADSSEALLRFSREASLLSSLHHPGIVSYVDHGSLEEDLPFLAMEWLEGEDLSQRLARQPLTLEETLAMLNRAAQALAVAHRQSVIHRDLKPSNIFLRHGRPEDAVLLDFGLARHTAPANEITVSQTMLGTPGYMAPEQASPEGPISPSADIFSLGCIVYQCLTGKPPFSAPHFYAVLSKILFTEPASLRSLRPELSPALEKLVESMLAKDPTCRLPDGNSLVEALKDPAPYLEKSSISRPPSRAPGVAGTERQLVSVLLASARAGAAKPEELGALRDGLRSLLAPHSARVELLANGALVVTLVATHGSARDPAALAARCALWVREHWSEAAVVLTTGLGVTDSHLPEGEAVDRAGQLLRQVELSPGETAAPVLLDEVTAGLLGPGFHLSRAQSGIFQLHGEQMGADESRPLLGKPTPCVGRERELAMLETAFTLCVDEPAAQAVLVTAPAGVGKSRLRHEFLRRLEHHGRPVLVMIGRGDQMSAGSADGLLAQALRRLCGIAGGQSLEDRRARLIERFARHLPADEIQETVEFLGELCGVPLPDEQSPRLRAARADPALLMTQMGRALVSLLKAECSQHAVLLVLEDLHWGDALTVRLLDEALRELAEQPFMVLALARPEVEQLLPGPWIKRMQQMPVQGLSRKAGARLVREVLGKDVSESLVDRLVEQSAGNSLFLEELIRGVAEGRGDSPPETVLAMLQARLMRLEPGARQVLLAASVLGRTFWFDGVRILLGQALTRQELDEWLRKLVELEWVEPQLSSRFPSEVEYRFRHALVRDAAYQVLTPGERQDHHERAASALVLQFPTIAEAQPEIVAHHYAEAGNASQAVTWFEKAGQRAVQRSAHTDAVMHYGRALKLIESLPEGPSRVRKELALRLAYGAPLMSTRGYAAPEVRETYARARELCRLAGDDAQLFPAVLGMWQFYMVGGEAAISAELGQQLLAQAENSKDATTLMLAHRALGTSLMLSGELVACREHTEKGLLLYDREKHGKLAQRFGQDPGVTNGLYLGWSLWFLGHVDKGLERAWDALKLARALEHPLSIAFALNYTATIHNYRGEHETARQLAEEATTISTEHKLALWLAMSKIQKGWSILGSTGQMDGAELLKEGVAGWRKTGAGAGLTFFLSALVWGLWQADQLDEAMATIEQIESLVNTKGERFFEAEVARLRGEVTLAYGFDKAQAAEECFRRGLEVARRQETKSWELRLGTSLGRLLKLQGRVDEARRMLKPTFEWFTEGLETADLVRARKLIAELG